VDGVELVGCLVNEPVHDSALRENGSLSFQGKVDGGEEGLDPLLLGQELISERDEAREGEGDSVLGHPEARPDRVVVELEREGGWSEAGEDPGGEGLDREQGVVGVLSVVVEDFFDGGEALQILLVVDVGQEDRTQGLEGAFGTRVAFEVIEDREVDDEEAVGDGFEELGGDEAEVREVELEVHPEEGVEVPDPVQEGAGVGVGVEAEGKCVAGSELGEMVERPRGGGGTGILGG